MRNFWEHLFWRTSANGYRCSFVAKISKWLFYAKEMNYRCSGNDFFMFIKWFSYSVNDFHMFNQQFEIWVYEMKFIELKSFTFSKPNLDVTKHSSKSIRQSERSDLSTLTVSLPLSRSHGRFFISHGFTNFKWIFSQTRSFVRKQTRQPSNSIRQHKPLPKKYLSIVLYIQKN